MVNRGCYSCVFILSLLLVCFGLPYVIVALTLHYDTTTCDKFSESSALILGSAYLAISFLGLILFYCRNAFDRGLNLFLMVLLFLCVAAFLLVLSLFAAGDSKFGDYLNRLQNGVTADKSWGFVKNCLVDSQFCDSFTDGHVYVQPTSATVLEKDLTPVMFGCCSPPQGCLYDKNSTIPEHEDSSDCRKWSGNANQLCYDCSLCKDRYLAKNIKEPWRSTLIFCIYSLVLSIIFSFMGFCVKSSVKHQQSKHSV